MAEVPILKIRKYWESQIDKNNFIELEKVHRYVDLVRLHRQLMKQLREDGLTVTTENSYQSYKKAHPALAELNKLSAQILALEASIKVKGKDKKEKRRPSLT